MLNRVISTVEEREVALKLIVDCMTGDDNAMSRFVDIALPNLPASSAAKKGIYLQLAQQAFEAVNDEVLREDVVVASRNRWREILEDSPYIKDEQYKDAFKDGSK